MSRYSPYSEILFKRNSGLLKSIYENECTICKCIRPNIEIHHNDQNNRNHDINNLVVVCSNCHVFIHKANIVVENIKKRHKCKLIEFTKKYFS